MKINKKSFFFSALLCTLNCMSMEHRSLTVMTDQDNLYILGKQAQEHQARVKKARAHFKHTNVELTPAKRERSEKKESVGLKRQRIEITDTKKTEKSVKTTTIDKEQIEHSSSKATFFDIYTAVNSLFQDSNAPDIPGLKVALQEHCRQNNTSFCTKKITENLSLVFDSRDMSFSAWTTKFNEDSNGLEIRGRRLRQ